MGVSYINNDVYSIVNEVAKQAVGSAPISVIDTESFVDMGKWILNSNDHTESFMSALMLRLARTYDTYRPYNSSLKDLLVSGNEWAAIYQKIDAEVPDFVSDETFNLEDGKSIDQYIVRKPKASQKLFIRRSPYSNFVTMTRKLLTVAFNSEAEFARFVALIAGKMRTKLDFAAENMARLAICNFVVNLTSSQEVHLLTRYNTESGRNLTKDMALLDPQFLAYVVGTMELYAKRMGSLSTTYNAEGKERHTPLGEQRFFLYDLIQTRLQTVLQYQAFHDEMVRLRSFIEVPYWQSEQDRTSIMVTGLDDSDATEERSKNNLIGLICDRYALGTFRSEEETLTTPINARARYWNTFHFAEQLWFNDMSENGVAFYLD